MPVSVLFDDSESPASLPDGAVVVWWHRDPAASVARVPPGSRVTVRPYAPGALPFNVGVQLAPPFGVDASERPAVGCVDGARVSIELPAPLDGEGNPLAFTVADRPAHRADCVPPGGAILARQTERGPWRRARVLSRSFVV